MSEPQKIRRQRHGIQVQQITITLPGIEMERLRKDARRQGITVSRHIVNLLRLVAASSVAPHETENAEKVAV